MEQFEYRQRRVGPFSLQEGTGNPGACRFFQVDMEEVLLEDMYSISIVVAGRMRMTHEPTGETQELVIGEGSYETKRKQGRLRYEALELGSRFVCVAPAGAGQRLRHAKRTWRFAEKATLQRKNSLLVVAKGALMVDEKFVEGPSIVWLKRGGSHAWATSEATASIEFWLEELRA